MIEQGRAGKIVNTAFMLSYQGGTLVPSHTASKSAVMGLTCLMACGLAKYNINTNAIAPGLYGHGQYETSARGSRPQQGHPGSGPCGPLGRT
jgi:NAD(P)-dependent dehydrogenase (short-subunit alcohol dehydrogenase family)